MTISFTSSAVAQERPSLFSISGYVKDLGLYTTNNIAGSGFDDLFNTRFNTKLYFDSAFTATFESRFLGYAGHAVGASASSLDASQTNGYRPFTLFSQNSAIGYYDIDRLWLNYTIGPAQLSLGRQRVAWGTNLVWNLIDVFNPYNILDFDYEERPGADVARGQYYFSPLTNLDLVVSDDESRGTKKYAAQFTTNNWNYDFHFMAATYVGGWVGGVAWAGDLWGVGFSGEVTMTGSDTDATRAFNFSAQRATSAAAIAFDYTFPSSLNIHAEAMYNELGVTQNIGLFRAQSLVLNLRSPARWSNILELAENISPLVRVSIFAIVDPIDGSLVVSPNVTWSAATNLDITFLAMIFNGATNSEFGGEGEIAAVRGKWSW